MKKMLVLLFVTLFILSCGISRTEYVEVIGPPGQDGAPGQDGRDGKDAALLIKKMAPANSCTNILPGIWVENIQNGRVFDVYFNQNCADAQGEYCDNVVPVEAATGSVNPGQGSGSLCWAGNYQFSGVLQDNGDIMVYVLMFEEAP